jgi:hypothetical protein
MHLISLRSCFNKPLEDTEFDRWMDRVALGKVLEMFEALKPEAL